jgi:hypothetical protein
MSTNGNDDGARARARVSCNDLVDQSGPRLPQARGTEASGRCVGVICTSVIAADKEGALGIQHRREYDGILSDGEMRGSTARDAA